MSITDLTGKRFERLVVKSKVEKASGRTEWLCKCDCGSEIGVIGYSLTSGNTKSCGCFKRDMTTKRFTKHGMRKTRVYNIWTLMKKRCLSKGSNAYHNYGGRGITVCDRWANSFDAFLLDMGAPKDSMTLERKDNNKGYYPENCKWATRGEQANNTRANRRLTHDGREMNLSEWARETSINLGTLWTRLNTLGWTVDKALTTPVRKLTKASVYGDSIEIEGEG